MREDVVAAEAIVDQLEKKLQSATDSSSKKKAHKMYLNRHLSDTNLTII